MTTVDSISSIVIFHMCMSLFESTLLSFCKPQSKSDLPTDLGSNSSECHIFNLFRCVLSFFATLAKRWKVRFRLGFANT